MVSWLEQPCLVSWVCLEVLIDSMEAAYIGRLGRLPMIRAVCTPRIRRHYDTRKSSRQASCHRRDAGEPRSFSTEFSTEEVMIMLDIRAIAPGSCSPWSWSWSFVPIHHPVIFLDALRPPAVPRKAQHVSRIGDVQDDAYEVDRMWCSYGFPQPHGPKVLAKRLGI